MRSLLQPVDLRVRKSFQTAFRCPLTQHILDYINVLDDNTTKNVTLRKDVEVYEIVLPMAKAWDMVPKRVF